MREKKFYNSRFQMAVLFLFSIGLVILSGWIVFLGMKPVIYWPRLVIGSLLFMLFLWSTFNTFKEMIRPSLLVKLTDSAVITLNKKQEIATDWEDIESYMIYRSSGGSTSIYLFLTEGNHTELPGHVKIGYSFMKDKHELIEAFGQKYLKEMNPDPELIRKIG
ncbi:hypothetical protein D3H55_13955 [Bacillus salacetis]|uniref:Uncharacterized protein n=1 Tax=Bacillus salacetis TaxID=2315464 RepID=A0A3A1QVH8_9BACI|nr:hypothetical protein [Bacillus salacetis]RIW31982.1 hypothetical protein D3H55_13955 [Bacillus salacetis]